MIKVIAFDLVGVLVSENDIELTEEEDKLERKFGNNYNDNEVTNNNKKIENTVQDIISKLYYVKDYDLFSKIKNKYKDIKIIITTNHVSYIKDYINNNLDSKYIDDIIVSADINMVKPNKDFFQYILNKYNIKPSELLFLDDSIVNIEGANKLGINTIKVNKDTNIYESIKEKVI